MVSIMSEAFSESYVCGRFLDWTRRSVSGRWGWSGVAVRGEDDIELGRVSPKMARAGTG